MSSALEGDAVDAVRDRIESAYEQVQRTHDVSGTTYYEEDWDSYVLRWSEDGITRDVSTSILSKQSSFYMQEDDVDEEASPEENIAYMETEQEPQEEDLVIRITSKASYQSPEDDWHNVDQRESRSNKVGEEHVETAVFQAYKRATELGPVNSDSYIVD